MASVSLDQWTISIVRSPCAMESPIPEQKKTKTAFIRIQFIMKKGHKSNATTAPTFLHRNTFDVARDWGSDGRLHLEKQQDIVSKRVRLRADGPYPYLHRAQDCKRNAPHKKAKAFSRKLGRETGTCTYRTEDHPS